MVTAYTLATDGCRLAYDCMGTGPGLLLLHGMGGTRRSWHDHGYVEELTPNFSVATLDLRGHGESGTPHNAAAYALPQMMRDLQTIANQCHWTHFAIIGFSLGGQLALHAALHLQNIDQIATVGAAFGPWLTAEAVTQTIAQMQHIAKAKTAGQLATLHLSSANQQMVEESDLKAHLACFRAASQWPVVLIQLLPCPALMICGTADAAVMTRFRENGHLMSQVGVQMRTVPDLTHHQSLTEREVVLPVLFAFLKDESDGDSQIYSLHE